MEPTPSLSRRQFLAASAVAAVTTAGCQDSGGEDTATPPPSPTATRTATATATPVSTFTGPFERTVDPTRTYLRTQGDDAGDASPVDLDAMGAQTGQTLRIERLGSFTGSSGGTGMTAVFSGSGDLGPSDQRERVVDAIDAGDDYETSPTYNGSAPTDIPEDFLVADNEGSQTSVTVTVPEGATHLFVAAIDNLYDDNGQGEQPFSVRITAE